MKYVVLMSQLLLSWLLHLGDRRLEEWMGLGGGGGGGGGVFQKKKGSLLDFLKISTQPHPLKSYGSLQLPDLLIIIKFIVWFKFQI